MNHCETLTVTPCISIVSKKDFKDQVVLNLNFFKFSYKNTLLQYLNSLPVEIISTESIKDEDDFSNMINEFILNNLSISDIKEQFDEKKSSQPSFLLDVFFDILKEIKYLIKNMDDQLNNLEQKILNNQFDNAEEMEGLQHGRAVSPQNATTGRHVVVDGVRPGRRRLG